jgi:hypothetical protein
MDALGKMADHATGFIAETQDAAAAGDAQAQAHRRRALLGRARARRLVG